MALVFIGAVSASGAWAQDAAPAAAPAATEAAKPADGGVEEIIVTSRLREESIQEVPIAVTAFNQEAIAALAPSTLRDFDGLTPNVFIGMNTAGPSAGAIFIRGLGYADIEKTQTSNVGVVVDGVSMPSSTVSCEALAPLRISDAANFGAFAKLDIFICVINARACGAFNAI